MWFSFPFLFLFFSLIACLALAAYSLVFFRWKCLEAKYFMKIHAWKICWMKLDWQDQSPLAPHLQEGSLKRRCAGQDLWTPLGTDLADLPYGNYVGLEKDPTHWLSTGWSSSVLPVFDALQHCVNAKALMFNWKQRAKPSSIANKGSVHICNANTNIILSSQTDLFVWHHHVGIPPDRQPAGSLWSNLSPSPWLLGNENGNNAY